MATEYVVENVNTALVIGGMALLGQLMTSLLNWIQSRQNHKKLGELHTQQIETKSELVETKHELNSRLTKLLEITEQAAHAKGVLEGIEQQKRRAVKGDTGEPDPLIEPPSS